MNRSSTAASRKSCWNTALLVGGPAWLLVQTHQIIKSGSERVTDGFASATNTSGRQTSCSLATRSGSSRQPQVDAWVFDRTLGWDHISGVVAKLPRLGVGGFCSIRAMVDQTQSTC